MLKVDYKDLHLFIWTFAKNFLSETGLIHTEEQKVRDMLNYSNNKVNELSKKNLKRLFIYESKYKQCFYIIVNNETIKKLVKFN